jgi:glycosyltransferase involved in cell wall biosynthesis
MNESFSYGVMSMKTTSDLTVVVLTFNEEHHLARCLESVRGLASKVVVIDSGSTDHTREMAVKYGAQVLVNPFVNQALQFNWGLDNAEIKTTWVMRLDADEIVTPKLRENILNILPTVVPEVAGLTVNRQIHFMGRWIRHGGIYPIRTLRFWRNGQGRCENRWMDEHIIVQGEIKHVDADIADINLNNITWWINKHNHYATREAIELLAAESRPTPYPASMSGSAHFKRWLKNSVYAKLPIGFRPVSYFFYRYVLRFGFMDGFQGVAFHGLQGLWYRFLVDVKCYELTTMMVDREQSLQEIVKTEYGYDI